MKYIIGSIAVLILIWFTTIVHAGSVPTLTINNNQVSIGSQKITTRGNISAIGAEENCQKYLQKFGKNAWKKSCISYTILVPNYKNKFGIFIKEELWGQELIGKTLYLYDISKKNLIDITSFLHLNTDEDEINFEIWYTGWKLNYTIWNPGAQKYSEPQSIELNTFTK